MPFNIASTGSETAISVVAQVHLVKTESMSHAISVAVSGMLIVGTVLLMISLFIAALPHILTVVSQYWPEVHEHHHSESYPESQVPDDGEVLAAIGFVLHTEFQRQQA